jgi:predicted lipoprotein with Yx(FWY)xxD motif
MKIKYLTSAGLTVVLAGIAVIIFAVGGGTAKPRPAHRGPAPPTINVRSTPLGKTLVDANGRTLYLFEGDKRNMSRLSNAGLAVWPRFVATGAVTAGKGVQPAMLGRTTTPRGVRQVTYNGHPLYYYAGDNAPGDTRGQALNQFGALWYVLGPAGNARTNTRDTAKAPSAATAPGYGY